MSTTRKQTAASTQTGKPKQQDASQLEQIEPLDQLADLVLNADDANLPELVREAGNWLLEAFQDPDRRTKLGSTFVIKLFLDGQKSLAAKPPEETEAEQNERRTILDQVDRLPPVHAKRLLREEIARRRADLEAHEERLRQLEGGP